MTLGALLAGGKSNNTAIIQDEISFSRDEVLAKVNQLKLNLKSSRRVLVVSNEAITVISALAACESLNIPIWIGHEFAGPAAFEAVSRSQCIDVQVKNGLELIPVVASTSSSESEGFVIHVMTSGTTGAPKIARHTPEALMGRVSIGKPGSESWLLTYPPSTFAGIQVLLTALAFNSTLVAYRSPTVAALAAAITRHGITHVSATPTFWRAALMILSNTDHVSSLRQITLGGEIADQPLLDRLASTFPNARIIHIYASTEAGALFSVTDQRSGFPAAWLSTQVNGVELRIRSGLLEVHSPRRMQSYISGHDSPFTEDNWLRTGDLVEVCGDRVYFRGRNDQVVNVGGSKVSPQEVETVVLGIEGVAEARVTGVRNPVSGSVLKAEIVAVPGFEPETLRKAIAERCYSVLPAYKVPRIVTLVPRLSMSAAGKKSGDVA